MAKQITTEEFIKKSRKKYSSRYDYSKIDYINNHTKIEIICHNHGSFFQTPRNHLRYSGCPICFGKLIINEFIKNARCIHDDLYDYSNVEYQINNKQKVEIVCKKHGSFIQRKSAHLLGNGCHKCATEKSANKQRKTIECFIKESILQHGEKYNYSNSVYINKSTKIEIICPNHGSFFQRPNDHIMGRGCRKCASEQYISVPESKWLDSLGISDEFRQIEITLNPYDEYPLIYTVDALVDDIIYEFYGDYWHGNPAIYPKETINKNTGKTNGELYEKTMQREVELRDAGYEIVAIWESEWNK